MVNNPESDVSCASSRSCMAVGSYIDLGMTTLVESWNGTKWSIVPSPSNPDSHLAFLNGVSCTSSTSCIAVGFYPKDTGVSKTLVEAT